MTPQLDGATTQLITSGGSDVMVFVFVALVFAATFGLLWVAQRALQPKRSAADRLDELSAGSTPLHSEVSRSPSSGEHSLAEQAATWIGERISGGSASEIESVQTTLRHAGFRHRRALEIYNGARMLALLSAPVFCLPLLAFFNLIPTLMAASLAMIIGYIGPSLYISSLASSRRMQMLLGFPDALDLLVSSVEAGLGVDQAFRRVSDEMATIAPQLAREFTLVNSEVTAGIDRLTALRNLEKRTGLDEVGSLVNMMAQAERYGTSIAEALRIFSQVTRDKRMARAEEAAGKVGSKITIIMIICFLPPLGIVLLVPTILTVVFGDL